MSDEYGSHQKYIKNLELGPDKRTEQTESALRDAFRDFIRKEELEVIIFSEISAEDLGRAIEKFPVVIKPLFVACNIAARAIERDLNIKNLDTYKPRVTRELAHILAGYIRPFLPPALPLRTLSYADRIAFIDKEIRKYKGQWEKRIVKSINALSGRNFKKRYFVVGGQRFELDAAYPREGSIKYGIDIKRIEARRDIHKRIDEIVNKASKLKHVEKESKFGAVIYYPFVDEHSNVRDRLESPDINSIVFASESPESIKNAVQMLLGKLGLHERGTLFK